MHKLPDITEVLCNIGKNGTDSGKRVVKFHAYRKIVKMKRFVNPLNLVLQMVSCHDGERSSHYRKLCVGMVHLPGACTRIIGLNGV